MENRQARGHRRRSGSAKHGDSEAIQQRRAKVRNSQKAFRERKKVAAIAQERAINTMTSTLLDLTDTILGSQTYGKDNSVITKLREAIEIFICLGGDADQLSDANCPIELAQEMVRGEQYDGVKSTGEKNLSSEENDSEAKVQRVNLTGITLPITPVITMDSILHAHPIAIRLIQHTLMIGHASLTGKRGFGTDVAMRLFRYAFLYHSRDEILSHLEWFLGSGQRDIVRLWNVSFTDSRVAQTASADFLRREHPHGLLPAVDTHAFERPPSGHQQTQQGLFWNAQEVELYLISNGARFLGQDMIELYLPTADSGITGSYSKDPRESNASVRRLSRPQRKTSDFVNFDALLPRLEKTRERGLEEVVASSTYPVPQMEAQRMVVQASLLFQNLANISLCMAKGPAYQAHEIRGAVMFSAMQSNNVPFIEVGA